MYEIQQNLNVQTGFWENRFFYKILGYFGFKLPSPDFPPQLYLFSCKRLAAGWYYWRSKEKLGRFPGYFIWMYFIFLILRFQEKVHLLKNVLYKVSFLSFIQKYDNLSNSCEKNIKIYRRVLVKSVLILVFPWKKKWFWKKVASRIRTKDP